ncbi:type II toxin-antitoxin system Phd/YefM family antitoxin [Streptomyces griseoluteus]|uniref:type II toxin-antitoxin system Phd/YefM family antitoxin n=1 Tax=Streptomyces griseoluteus TaxID=29306 RepID=UPI0037FBDFD9
MCPPAARAASVTLRQPSVCRSVCSAAMSGSAEDYESWQETVYLLRSPANARRLMEAVARDKAAAGAVTKSLDELRELAGEE